MFLKHFLTCLDSDEYQTLGILMFPHKKHVWFIGCVFNTPCPICAFSMHWSWHIVTSYTYLCYLVMYWSITCFFILACHVYLMLCSILFCLRCELHFLIHLAPLMHHYHCSYLHLLPSFFLDLFVYSCQKGESIL